MNDYSVFVVLCEDRQHEVFMQTFLVNRGIPARRIRVEIALESGGSGEQYVRRKYPEEVKAYRRKCNQPLKQEAPPSLQAVCPELQRIM